MAVDHNGRPFTRSEDRTTRYRVYPIAGEPSVGAVPVVNAALDLEFSAAGVAGGYWEPVTNGDSENPELVFYDGDVVMTWVTD